MSDERRLRQEIARERAELTGAVATLREELGRLKRRVPALAVVALALLTALRVGLRRLRNR